MTPSLGYRFPWCCGLKMARLYIRKGGKVRWWVPVGFFCTSCKKTIIK